MTNFEILFRKNILRQSKEEVIEALDNKRGYLGRYRRVMFIRAIEDIFKPKPDGCKWFGSKVGPKKIKCKKVKAYMHFDDVNERNEFIEKKCSKRHCFCAMKFNSTEK